MSALALFRATVVSTDDPQALGRVRLRTLPNGQPAAAAAEGWADVPDMPVDLGGGRLGALVPSYAVGDVVLFAADHPPFVGAIVLGRARRGAAAAGASTLVLQMGVDGLRIDVPSGSVHLSAPAVQVDAAMSSFSGVVRCSTLVAESVVAASVTPGAGNVW